MRVVDLMTTRKVSCTESCTAETAANLLQGVDCGVVPVLSEVSGQVLGVITERSLCLEVVAQRHDPATVLAGDCLDRQPAVCHPEDDAYRVLADLAPCHARGVIVLNDSNELQGELSISVLATRVATAAQELYAALKKVNQENAQASKAA